MSVENSVDPNHGKVGQLDRALLKGLRDHVHDRLRRAIIAGDLPAGVALNERQLAAELGVSTTPLKEALRLLEQEGLVATLPRRGVRVTFDIGQAEEMTLARAALEGVIARKAAGAALDHRDDLAQVIASMETATATGDVAAVIALNEAFHERIHQRSGCPYLSRLLVGQTVYVQTTRELLMGDAAERGLAFAEHHAIYQALVGRDGDRAEQTMRDHVLRSGFVHVRAAFANRASGLI